MLGARRMGKKRNRTRMRLRIRRVTVRVLMAVRVRVRIGSNEVATATTEYEQRYNNRICCMRFAHSASVFARFFFFLSVTGVIERMERIHVRIDFLKLMETHDA